MSAAADDVKKSALEAINRHFLLNHPAQAADLVDGFGNPLPGRSVMVTFQLGFNPKER